MNNAAAPTPPTPSYKPTDAASASAHVSSLSQYSVLYEESLRDNDGFWAKQAERLDWIKKWDKGSDCNFNEVSIRWFQGGKLNASHNCVDRHVQNGHGDVTAIIWEGNDPAQTRKISYRELHEQVQRAANALKASGVQKGDRVCIYLQMIPEMAVAILACARIGAVHSVVFGAFSAESLISRINDSSCKVIITQDTGVRGTKQDIPMKANVDKAIGQTPTVEKVFVVRRTGSIVEMKEGRDIAWQTALDSTSPHCEPEAMDAEDPLFILYTSGSTGKPKGVLHATGGYLLYASVTHHYVFDYKPGDVYWCTADVGWITGHSYLIYGPLANRATVVMFEGVPNFPDYGRFWQVIEKHKVNIFYTAPTALRSLMKEGDAWPGQYNLSSLRLLGTVGEPIKSPEWTWYHKVIGKGHCPIVDTWWQTETGGILITPLPGATPTKPGSATLPFFGIRPAVMTDQGEELHGNDVRGCLVLSGSWPGQMRTVYGDHQRFVDTYFKRFPGKYFTGDGCWRDPDGYYWITGRVDDIIIVSGHNIGTAEVEGAIGQHNAVAEAAVVGYPHDIKGTAIYAYVTLKTGQVASDQIRKEINLKVREVLGPHAAPEKLQFADGLPKTRSGKIMRRILRKIAENELDNLGDISTLAEPAVVESLVSGRVN